MRQLLFLFSASLFLYPFASASACGDVVKKEDILINRASQINNHCVNLYVMYPRRSGTLTSQWPRLSGEGFSVQLVRREVPGYDGKLFSYFCLSESALKQSKIIIRYEDGLCVSQIDLDNLSEMLAETDKASDTEVSD